MELNVRRRAFSTVQVDGNRIREVTFIVEILGGDLSLDDRGRSRKDTRAAMSRWCQWMVLVEGSFHG